MWERGTETREDGAPESREGPGRTSPSCRVSLSATARVLGGLASLSSAPFCHFNSTQRSESGQARSHVSWALLQDAWVAPDRALWSRQSREQTRGPQHSADGPRPTLHRAEAPTQVPRRFRPALRAPGGNAWCQDKFWFRGGKCKSGCCPLFQHQRSLRGRAGTRGHLLSGSPWGSLRGEEPAMSRASARHAGRSCRVGRHGISQGLGDLWGGAAGGQSTRTPRGDHHGGQRQTNTTDQRFNSLITTSPQPKGAADRSCLVTGPSVRPTLATGAADRTP